MKSKKINFFLLTLVLFIAPTLTLFLQSLSSVWRFQAGEGFDFQWESYRVLFSDPKIWSATFWSLGIGTGVLFINLLLGLATGKALSISSFKGKPFMEALFLTPILIPVLAIAMGIHFYMIRIGLADSLFGVIIIHLVPTVPYSIKVFHNSYNLLGKNMMEQSQILGAAPWRQLVTIELPLLKTAIRSVTFLTIVISLSQYAITAIIGGGRIITLPMVFFPFLNTANSSLMAAFATWFTLLPIVMYVMVELCMLLLPYTRMPWRNLR